MIKKTAKKSESWKARERLRQKGQFWTPAWVAKAMVAYVVREHTDLLFDPATGSGAFLEALRETPFSEVFYYGLDIDEDLLALRIYDEKKCRVELRDFLRNPPDRKFKAIVANPPYIRHHRLSSDMKKYLRELATSITLHKIDGRAGYHVYFLILALAMLERGGRLSFILPADTFEGVFANTLWKWISSNFCIEAVVSFAEEATPFPGVDTNALIVFIKNDLPEKTLKWVYVKENIGSQLEVLVKSHFSNASLSSVEIWERNLKEAVATGLSRMPQEHEECLYHLYDFAKVMRGVATGANNFFFLTLKQIRELQIPLNYFKRAVGRTKDVKNSVLTKGDIEQLDLEGRPTYLLSLSKNMRISNALDLYLKKGVEQGLHQRSLIKQRKPWYKMEQRKVPPILFTYLGRRNSRFILNKAGVIPLTGFLCVYPNYPDDEKYVLNLWKALNDPETIGKLRLVGKSYGNGAIKVEPSNLSRLPIPDEVVFKYGLRKKHLVRNNQLALFSD